MNAIAKKAYQDEMAAQLREWAATVEVVKARIAKGTSASRVEYRARIKSWNKKEPAIIEKLKELKLCSVASAKKYAAMKSGVQTARAELNQLIESLEEKQK